MGFAMAARVNFGGKIFKKEITENYSAILFELSFVKTLNLFN